MQNRELHKMWMKEQCPVIKCSNLNTLFREKYMDTWVSLEKKKKMSISKTIHFFHNLFRSLLLTSLWIE